MPTQQQATLLVRFGYSYQEIRNWTEGQAGKVLRQLIEDRNKVKKCK